MAYETDRPKGAAGGQSPEMIISPYMSRMRFDVILCLSLLHRSLEIVLYGAMVFTSIFVLGLLKEVTLFQTFSQTVVFAVMNLLVYLAVIVYIFLELRFVVFKSGLIEMNKRNMLITAYGVIALSVAAIPPLVAALF